MRKQVIGQSKSRSRSRSRDRRIHRRWQPPCYTIYVLKLTQGKYYVGRTQKPITERLDEHTTGRLAAVWSRKYQPLCILESMRSSKGMTELSITKEYMARYGIDNVRGSCYCRVKLTLAEREKLQLDIKEIRAQLDLCFNCGGKHQSSKCLEYISSQNMTPSNNILTLRQLLNMNKSSPTQPRTPLEADTTHERLSGRSDIFSSNVQTSCFVDITENKHVIQFTL